MKRQTISDINDALEPLLDKGTKQNKMAAIRMIATSDRTDGESIERGLILDAVAHLVAWLEEEQ